MKNLYKLLFHLFLAFLTSYSAYAQCGDVLDVIICDMETIDGNNDASPEGLINLYTTYFDETGITLENGEWVTLEESLAAPLDGNTGDLFIWEYLFSSASSIGNYSYQLMTTSCGDTPRAQINIELGSFSGEALPPSGTNDINLEVCDVSSINLFETLTSDDDTPSPHLNGEWSIVNQPSNAIDIEITDDGFLSAEILYQEGIPLTDKGEFTLQYIVPQTLNCSLDVTTVKLSVVRGVDAGTGNTILVTEDEILSGIYDNDIDLTDDIYLFGEDVEGNWLPSEYIEGSNVNIKEIYDDIIVDEGERFGNFQISFIYLIDSRSGVCGPSSSEVTFRFVEKLRPFEQPEPSNNCQNPELTTLNLYDLIEFTTQNGFTYEYDNDNFVNWQFISGASDLGLIEQPENDSDFDDTIDYYLGTLDLTEAVPGEYVFRFAVSSQVNNPSFGSSFCDPFDSPIEVNYCNNDFDLEILTTDVTVTILDFDYAGENTSGVVFCENEGEISLIEYLAITEFFTEVSENGVWTDASNTIIDNAYTIPQVDADTSFQFTYTTKNLITDCEDMAVLDFMVTNVVNVGSSGESITTDGIVKVCTNDLNINLFDLIQNANPIDSSDLIEGQWTGPNQYVSADHIGKFLFNDQTLTRLVEGEYVYTVGDGENCTSITSTSIFIDLVDPITLGDPIFDSFCKNENQVDLITLLDASTPQGGVFTDLDASGALTGSIVDFTSLSGQYEFEYTLDLAPCEIPSQKITIEVIDIENPPSAGSGPDSPVSICSNNLTVDLFDFLEGNPSLSGIWTGDFGYESEDHLGRFINGDKDFQILGSGRYVYNVGGVNACGIAPSSASVTIEIIEPIELGDDIFNLSFCKQLTGINLYDLLADDTTAEGEFNTLDFSLDYNLVDIDFSKIELTTPEREYFEDLYMETTDEQFKNALGVDGFLSFTDLQSGVYNFEYSIPNIEPCDFSSLNVQIRITELDKPFMAPAEFCILDYKLLGDVDVNYIELIKSATGEYEVQNVEMSNLNWYSSPLSDQPIIGNPKLLDGDIYYVANEDGECESDRLTVEVSILNIGEEATNGDIECPLEFQDGVSADGNTINDTFSLNWKNEAYDIEKAFPNFEFEIYNRYGVKVYKGNSDTAEFKGDSNVSLSIGSDLPSGVYFYIFKPNFKNNAPIQGSFYLSK